MTQPAAAAIPQEAPAEYSGANQQEEYPSKKLYDEILADELYKDYSSQNNLTIQVFLALSFGGATYFGEVRNSYAFLAQKIDPAKLVKDPAYKRQVERALQLVKRHEGGKIADGSSKLTQNVTQTEKAIERTNATHSKLKATKSNLLNENIYLQQLQIGYGLSDKQLKIVRDRAWAKITENPSLSLSEVLRQEAQLTLLGQVRKEVEKENKGKNLTKEEKDIKIELKFAQKRKDFEKNEKTKQWLAYEKIQTGRIVAEGIHDNRQILTVAPPVVAPSQPTTQMVVPPPPIAPPLSVSATPVSLPKFNFPNFSLPGNMFGGLGKMFGGLGKGLGSFFGKNGMLSKGFDAATKLGKQLLNRGIDAFLPGAGAVIGKINDVIKSILGIDVEGLVVKGTLLVMGVLVSIMVFLPIIIGIGVFSHITGSNPVQVSMTSDKTIGWNEFNKQYLTVETNTKLSWQQFEKENLVSSRQYLSLEKTSPEP